MAAKHKSKFRRKLEDAVLERHCANHPMTEKWAKGELGRDALMGWGVEHWHWVSKMPKVNFYICAHAAKDEIELQIENFHDETADERPHLNIVLRFAEANGADIEHGGRGFRALERHCVTRAQQEEAIHFARESARMRWFYFDGIYLHYEQGYLLQ